MRFKAPEHTSEIFLTSGPRRADEDGFIEIHDDVLTDADERMLAGAGFITEEEVKARESAAAAEAKKPIKTTSATDTKEA